MSWPVKVDVALVVVVGLAFVGMGIATAAVAADPGARDALPWVLVVNLAIVATVLALGVPVRYDLTGEDLRVRSGLLRQAMAWRAVVRVELTFSLVASTTAAWTASRVLLIDERGRVLEVGPADRVGFVAEVLARAPQLVEDPRAGRQRAWHDPARERRRPFRLA